MFRFNMKNLYRYEIQYQNTDGDETKVYLREFEVKRETESSYFVELPTYARFSGKLKRINKNAYNTFAYDTKEKALDHFKRRTFRRIQWFDYWKEECEKALEIAETIKL